VALSRIELMADVWDDHWHGSTKTLDVHVAALRAKLAAAAEEVGRDRKVALPEITTLRGHGYRLEPPA
jgi:DNA-binding response OmpR family regulator